MNQHLHLVSAFICTSCGSDGIMDSLKFKENIPFSVHYYFMDSIFCIQCLLAYYKRYRNVYTVME